MQMRPECEKKILLTSRSGQLGGMEMRLADEARFLASKGCKCLLAPSKFPNRDQWLEDLLQESELLFKEEFNPPPFFEQWKFRRTNLSLARFYWVARLKAMHADLAHVFYAWTQEGGTRVWLCHKAGIPVVLSIHNAFPAVTFTSWHDTLTRQSFSSVKGLYAVSESAMEHFLSIYEKYLRKDAVIRVIPNFVDVRRFVPSTTARFEERNKYGIPNTAKVIGSIGRIDTQKRPYELLDLFDRLCSKRSDVYLVFCGRGPLEASVREETLHRPWADRVRFLGFRKDVERVFPMLDVHVLLSKQEGFGIATAEAMSCGVPVVVSDVPGSRDVVGDSHSGTLVPFGRLEETMIAIERFLDSPLLTQVAAEQGRLRATAHFSREIWTARLTEFYDSVMPTPLTMRGESE